MPGVGERLETGGGHQPTITQPPNLNYLPSAKSTPLNTPHYTMSNVIKPSSTKEPDSTKKTGRGFKITNNTDGDAWVTLPDDTVVTVAKSKTSTTWNDSGKYVVKNSSADSGKEFFTVTRDNDDGAIHVSPGTVDVTAHFSTYLHTATGIR
ncbi:hypothetical protein BC827DRAFT_1156442 [Russula dissimulans]|nr:hypothetical protein BC827DRAFT_1156442 [Russula dissimulans]